MGLDFRRWDWRKSTLIRRGEIYWVNLDPTLGSEIKKTRPALVISNDQNNQFADTVTVLPITSSTKSLYPFEAPVAGGTGGLKENGKIKTNQIRTVDKRRLSSRPLGAPVDSQTLQKAEKALSLHLALH